MSVISLYFWVSVSIYVLRLFNPLDIWNESCDMIAQQREMITEIFKFYVSIAFVSFIDQC